jgi:hypothetical protein
MSDLTQGSPQKYDYNIIRPVATRNMQTFILPAGNARYTGFGQVLLDQYDIQLGEEAQLAITNNPQLPTDHPYPSTSESWFRRKLIKVICVQLVFMAGSNWMFSWSAFKIEQSLKLQQYRISPKSCLAIFTMRLFKTPLPNLSSQRTS